MTQPAEYSREWFLQRAEESAAKMAELAAALPGCFHADGTPIISSAHLPKLPNTTAKDPTQ